MKKIVFALAVVLISSISLNAHPFEKGFGYELPFQFQIGKSHAVIQQPFKNTFYGYKAGSEFNMYEIGIGFIHLSFSDTPSYTTNQVVLDYWPVSCHTYYSRIGICVGGVHWIGNHFLTTQSLVLTLITTNYGCSAGDSSSNLIGWTNEMLKERNNFNRERNDFGIKLDYNIGVVGVSLINTFYETTLSLHLNFGAKDVTKICINPFKK